MGPAGTGHAAHRRDRRSHQRQHHRPAAAPDLPAMAAQDAAAPRRQVAPRPGGRWPPRYDVQERGSAPTAVTESEQELGGITARTADLSRRLLGLGAIRPAQIGLICAGPVLGGTTAGLPFVIGSPVPWVFLRRSWLARGYPPGGRSVMV